MMYCIQLEYPLNFEDSNSKVKLGFNLEASSSDESLLIDRVLNRIKTISVLQYPMMDSELRF